MTSGHGGNIWDMAKKTGRMVGGILDFSANINPLGPPAYLRSLISSSLESLIHYPDPDSTRLKYGIKTSRGRFYSHVRDLYNSVLLLLCINDIRLDTYRARQHCIDIYHLCLPCGKGPGRSQFKGLVHAG